MEAKEMVKQGERTVKLKSWYGMNDWEASCQAHYLQIGGLQKGEIDGLMRLMKRKIKEEIKVDEAPRARFASNNNSLVIWVDAERGSRYRVAAEGERRAILGGEVKFSEKNGLLVYIQENYTIRGHLIGETVTETFLRLGPLLRDSRRGEHSGDAVAWRYGSFEIEIAQTEAQDRWPFAKALLRRDV